MMNYGGSITSSFPMAFCSAPTDTNCQICGIKNGAKINSNNLNQTRIKYELVVKIDKCLHCDLNICDQCLNKSSLFNYYNQEKEKNEQYCNDDDDDDDDDDNKINEDNLNLSNYKPNIYEQHYKTVKKEFKQNYSYLKITTEKLNNLQNIIKSDEFNLNELNLIKQQINTKANDLIRQIENEKIELNEYIDSIINNYEIIKAVNSNLTLKELLELHQKSKSLCDYIQDEEKITSLIHGELPKFTFEEKPVYRNLIGQLNLNQSSFKNINTEDDNKNDVNANEIINENLSKKIQKPNMKARQQTLEMSRSVSLNDLITAANELIIKEKTVNKKLNSSSTSLSSSSTTQQPQQKQELHRFSSPSLNTIYSKQLNTKISNEIKNRIEIYRNKLKPVQRLELDILPTYLRYSNNKLLVASSNAKIRIFDLNTNRIEKDEIKNVMITSICIPLNRETNDILFAITNGNINEDDEHNLSNSVIIVTKKELKVLKNDDQLNLNEDYKFLNPCSICYDKFNNLYVCDSGYNRIKIFDTNLVLTEVIHTASNLDDYLNQPKSICICNEKSILFVCDSGNHRILSFDILNSGKKFAFKSIYGYGYGEDYGKMRFPLDCSADNLGFLVIRDHHNSRIQIFSPNTMLIHTIEFNSDLETIYSLTVCENGSIYVAKMAYSQEFNSLNGQYTNMIKYFIDIY